MPGMIKKEDIEKVRATADLYDIVSATVTLKPSGTGTYVGLCPFHDEKTPSFSVRPALGVWHCFGCGLGGDVFGYVEHQENIDFRDAVELLADKYHIELHYDKADNVPAHTGSKRARLLEANEAAQEYFVSQLMTKEALAARKLYEDDTINAKYINTPDTQLYRKTQVLYGIDLAKSAIVKKRQAVIVEGYTDVMAMHLAGIDTAVATCGTAFGAEHAKIIRRLIADDSLGAVQLVGPLKVEGQALSSRVVFTFDGDAAGQKAAIHAFGLDAAFSTQAFVAVAEDNLDPCDLRIKRGNEAVRALIANARPLYDFVIDSAIDRFDTTYVTGQMGAVKAVAPLIAQIRDRSLLDLYSRKAVRRIGVDLDIMQREVAYQRRKLNVRDEDAYAPKRRFQNNAGPSAEPAYAERGANPYANPAARKALEHRDAAEQSYYRIDDAVFICEQQFMATLIQVPLAVDPTMFASLTLSSFMTPVFRTLFQAVAAAGGLPGEDVPQGLWMHNLTKAGGPMLESVINELAVMPLPLPPSEADANRNTGESQEQSAQLRKPTQEERRYASELIVRLLDTGIMRKIGAAQRRMAQLPDGAEKIELLGQITKLETLRKDLQSRVFGNNVA